MNRSDIKSPILINFFAIWAFSVAVSETGKKFPEKLQKKTFASFTRYKLKVIFYLIMKNFSKLVKTKKKLYELSQYYRNDNDNPFKLLKSFLKETI